MTADKTRRDVIRMGVLRLQVRRVLCDRCEGDDSAKLCVARRSHGQRHPYHGGLLPLGAHTEWRAQQSQGRQRMRKINLCLNVGSAYNH